MPGAGSADAGTKTGVERRASGSTATGMAATYDAGISTKTKMQTGLLRSGSRGL